MTKTQDKKKEEVSLRLSVATVTDALDMKLDDLYEEMSNLPPSSVEWTDLAEKFVEIFREKHRINQ